MNKRIARIAYGIAVLAATVSAQTTTTGSGSTNFSNPANIIWGIVAIMGTMATAFFALSLIWTAIQGAFVDHDQFHKLGRIAFWAAICFSATFISGRFALGG
jgi:hypothetical protein